MYVFDIVFDGGQVLYSGQRLSGKVLCHSTKSFYVKSIQYFIGYVLFQNSSAAFLFQQVSY